MTITKAQHERAYDADVSSWIADALASGPTDFHRLLLALPGVYPTVVLESLNRMEREGRLAADVVSKLTRQTRTPLPGTNATIDPLPLPHPLDFEWRYNKPTALKLLSFAQTLAWPDDRVVLLGTPGVALAAMQAPIDRSVVFVGEDNVVTHTLSSLTTCAGANLLVESNHPRARMPSGAGVVILDPPWYLDFICPMLSLAASSCRVGGFILLSQIPSGTRPGAAQDRARIAHYLRKLSLDVMEIHKDTLSYQTPFFEANALAASGLVGVPGTWRRSDLMILRKTADAIWPPFARTTQRRWREVSIGRMRVFVRNDDRPSSAGPILRSLVQGDILPTVSRRDVRRRNASVWTSGNRIFASRRPDLVLAAAKLAGGEKFPNRQDLSKSDRDAVNRLSYDLRALARREEAEERKSQAEETACSIDDSMSPLTNLSTTSPTTVFG
jgi:hypothetical protein